ncbi:MAG: hypothetical protein AABZ06_12685 [Bdellovibrionota bacterium]
MYNAVVSAIISFAFTILGVSAFCAESALSFHREKLHFAIPSNKQIEATILVPDKPVKSKFPVMLVFGGFQEAARVLELINPPSPVVVGSFDYPFLPPRKFEFPSSLKHAPAVKALMKDTLDGIGEFIRTLKLRDDVDVGRFTIVGASLGAPFAIAAAEKFQDIKGLAIIHGFGDVPGTAMHQFIQAWQSRYGIWSYPVAWALSWGGWLYLNILQSEKLSPEKVVKTLRPSQKVIFVSARHDSFIPKESTEVLVRELKKSKASVEFFETSGDHLQPGSGKLVSEVLELLSRWALRVGLI